MAINANIASGDDDPDDADLGTFNPLSPRGSYFSEAAVLGPRNFVNLHPFVTVHPTDAWSLTADVNFFWRLDVKDGVYSPSGRLIRSGSASNHRFVGSAVSLASDWQIERHLNLTAVYTRFFPGAFIEDTGPAEDIDFFEVSLRFRFQLIVEGELLRRIALMSWRPIAIPLGSGSLHCLPRRSTDTSRRSAITGTSKVQCSAPTNSCSGSNPVSYGTGATASTDPTYCRRWLYLRYRRRFDWAALALSHVGCRRALEQSRVRRNPPRLDPP